MEQIFSKLKFITHGEGFIDITYDLNLCVEKNNFHSGILNLISLHTSCSLTINENADPNVLRDLKKYMQSIVPYDSYLTLSKNREEISYKHYQEGADDMPAHIKTSLTNTCLSLSFQDGKIMLGTWQAVYLWEHRFDQKERIINVSGMKMKMSGQLCLLFIQWLQYNMIISSWHCWAGELQDGRINRAMFQMSPTILLLLLLMITNIHKTHAGIIHISSPSLPCAL